MFLRNAWYAVGWVSETQDGKISRTVLNQPIVCFRKSDGRWAGVSDRCPHRFAPLHKGRIIGDTIQCGYHGLQFDGSGKCVYNPIGNGKIPDSARIESFPVVERYGLLWIWLGNPAAADENLVANYAVLDSPNWVHATGGYVHCEANYQLVVDNLMDLSHVAFLHPLFGNESMTKGKLTVAEEGSVIRSNLWCSDIASPPFFGPRFEAGSPIDHWLDMRWQAPSNLLLDFGATEVDRPRGEGSQGWACHILTPETDTATHYFFGISRLQGPGASTAVFHDHEAQKAVFASEDKPMLESCQTLMRTTDLWSLKPVMLGGDRAAVRVRRALSRLIEAESSAAVYG
jgi:phenylpropionate dioxygenase-like ring-hydroxylating dioxygenase large terminal subunit